MALVPRTERVMCADHGLPVTTRSQILTTVGWAMAQGTTAGALIAPPLAATGVPGATCVTSPVRMRMTGATASSTVTMESAQFAIVCSVYPCRRHHHHHRPLHPRRRRRLRPPRHRPHRRCRRRRLRRLARRYQALRRRAHRRRCRRRRFRRRAYRHQALRRRAHRRRHRLRRLRARPLLRRRRLRRRPRRRRPRRRRRRHRPRRLKNSQSCAAAGTQACAPARRQGSGIQTSCTRCALEHRTSHHVRVHYASTC